MARKPADKLTPTVAAVERFLKANPMVAGSPEAALALAAARDIDDPSASTTSRSMVMGRYLDALAVLRELAPEVREESPLDEIRARRDKRVAGQPVAAGRVGRGRRRAS